MKSLIKRLLLPFYRLYYDAKWLAYKKSHQKIKLVIGSSRISEPGWFETDILVLDVTKENNFRRFFSESLIDMVVAEHVLEHLTTEQIELMARHVYKYSSPGLNMRIAVPDGFHADEKYIEMVKPGGIGAGADDHKHLFTYQFLSQIFAQNGFKATLLEYWDENNTFHTIYQNDEKGKVRRSFVNDARNADGKPHYTSLIIDFKKA